MIRSSYDLLGRGYRTTRRPDRRIASAIQEALGDAPRVVNVGAGTGSYEPTDRRVVAVEPSLVMIRQRPVGSAPAVRAVAEALPFREAAFDAGLAVLTLHHWSDWRRGIAELRRVASRRIVILTWDPEGPAFWLVQRYFPEFAEIDRHRFPTMPELQAELRSDRLRPIPIPEDCTDGFLGAFWKRPEAYLDPRIRAGMSVFAGVGEHDPRLRRLEEELADGTWERLFGRLRTAADLDLGYRLLVGRGGGTEREAPRSAGDSLR